MFGWSIRIERKMSEEKVREKKDREGNWKQIIYLFVLEENERK